MGLFAENETLMSRCAGSSPALCKRPSLVSISKELGVTNDFLLTGKEGVATEAIPAIKADKTLSPDVKKALISLVGELGKTT